MEATADIRYVEVAVFAALDKLLHYTVPEQWRNSISLGQPVLVPLRNATATGIVMKCHSHLEAAAELPILKPLLAVSDTLPTVPDDLLRLSKWISDYYFYPLGETLRTLLPPGLEKKPTCRIRPTSAGKRRKDSPPELLRWLNEHGPQSLQALKARFKPSRRLRQMLEELTSQGWVEQSYEWGPAGSRPATVKWVRLRSGASLEETGSNPKGRQLMELLQAAGGKLLLQELRPQVANVDYWTRKLSRAGVIEVGETVRARSHDLAQAIPETPPPILTEDQRAVCDAVADAIATPHFFPAVLHGITGSGKTEIYLHLVAKTLASGRSALILAPEIALSTQLEALFRQRFGDRLGIWHSGFSAADRSRLWHEIASGKVTITLGVRSAVFSPLRDLGLILVDEEHDLSYKQEDRLRYHARDVALMRAKMLGIPILLGSATPSLQSIQHCREGRYQLLTLDSRIDDQPLPELEIVDMRRERGPYRFLSGALQDALTKTLASGRQAILFLNRRGFATFLLCRLCGQVIKCRHCSVSLTYHQQENSLCCHYCGFSMAPPEVCPVCSKAAMLPLGFGTERVEEEVKRLLPNARSVRIDRDSVANPRHLVELLNTVRSGRADVLIGTQMIAKGHDFPGITLVGVINADTALQIADFRAGEATVQMLIQVAGRAGRRDVPGRVILQTYNPAHYTIQSVRKLDYNSFCTQELESRKQLQYPPFCRFTKLLVTAKNQELARLAASQLSELCLQLLQSFREQGRHLAILGPAPAPVTKLKDRYRWHLYVKGWLNRDIHDFLALVMARAPRLEQLRRTDLTIDRDPVSSY